MLSAIHEIELISNFYITFYTNDVNMMIDGAIDLQDPNIITNIMKKLNNNNIVRIVYDSTSIDDFTRFFSSFMSKELNIISSEERLNICMMKNIMINPILI
jgi:hypothetical protein